MLSFTVSSIFHAAREWSLHKTMTSVVLEDQSHIAAQDSIYSLVLHAPRGSTFTRYKLSLRKDIDSFYIYCSQKHGSQVSFLRTSSSYIFVYNTLLSILSDCRTERKEALHHIAHSSDHRKSVTFDLTSRVSIDRPTSSSHNTSQGISGCCVCCKAWS